jgi:hypothetical protein
MDAASIIVVREAGELVLPGDTPPAKVSRWPPLDLDCCWNAARLCPREGAVKTWRAQLHALVKDELEAVLLGVRPGHTIKLDGTFRTVLRLKVGGVVSDGGRPLPEAKVMIVFRNAEGYPLWCASTAKYLHVSVTFRDTTMCSTGMAWQTLRRTRRSSSRSAGWNTARTVAR